MSIDMRDIIIADMKEFVTTIKITSWNKLTKLEQMNINSIENNINNLKNK